MSDCPDCNDQSTRLYVASLTKHADRWIELNDNLPRNVRIVASWPWAGALEDPDDYRELWASNVAQCFSADACLAYHEPGDVWKGAYIEIGVCLAVGAPIFLVGDPPGSWVHHPGVIRCESIEKAMLYISLYRPRENTIDDALWTVAPYNLPPL